MPLVPATLANGLAATITAPDPATAANVWTNALTTYLSTAIPPLPPVNTDPLIRSAITPVLMAPNPAPNALIGALEMGLVGVVMATIPVALPGAVPVATPTLQPMIAPILLSGMAAPNSQVVLNQLAAAIDGWCRTVVYGIPPQPPSIPLA